MRRLLIGNDHIGGQQLRDVGPDTPIEVNVTSKNLLPRYPQMQTGCRPCSCFLVGIDRAGGQQLLEVGPDTLIEVGLTSSEIIQVYKILLKAPEATLAAQHGDGRDTVIQLS